MSQPSNRFKDLPALWNVDKSREEIWFGNPWKVSKLKQNLSAFERNQIFLNLSQDGFLNIGYLTKADSDGDGRGVMVADVTGDMQPDLVVCQAGGGPLRIYANRFPPSSRLIVSLEGVASNGLGIGASVIAEVEGQKILRQVFPDNNFITSQASQVHLGLGSAQKVDRLTVKWPSGTVQEFTSVPTGMHIRIIEDQPKYQVLLRSEVSETKTLTDASPG